MKTLIEILCAEPETIADRRALKSLRGYLITSEQIKAFRIRHGLSQSGLAKLLGVHSMTVSSWEVGKQVAPAYVELALCELARRLS